MIVQNISDDHCPSLYNHWVGLYFKIIPIKSKCKSNFLFCSQHTKLPSHSNERTYTKTKTNNPYKTTQQHQWTVTRKHDGKRT